jgi:hypothetical protein
MPKNGTAVRPRAYICGPMRGVPLYNFPAFDAAARGLRRVGFDVVNPADFDRAAGFDPSKLPESHDWSSLPKGFDLRKMAVQDMEHLATCDAIVVLPGWDGSKGAQAELAFANWLGLHIVYWGQDNVTTTG